MKFLKTRINQWKKDINEKKRIKNLVANSNAIGTTAMLTKEKPHKLEKLTRKAISLN